MYDYDEVRSQPVIFTHDTFYFQSDYWDPIGIWLDNSFAERYPLHSILHILNYVNGVMDDLILSICYDCVIQLWFLVSKAYILTGLELRAWLHWIYDYT